MGYTLTLKENTDGRDFVVGDIHGCYDLLMDKLQAIGFNFDTDRLISVGDIVDRGPSSALCATSLLEQPWFLMIKGNHEELFLSSEWYTGKDNHTPTNVTARHVHLNNGGAWINALTEKELKRIHENFLGLPDMIEVPYRGRTYGVIHAELPFGESETIDWEYVKQQVETTGVVSIKWSRNRAKKHNIPWAERAGSKQSNVEGIDLVYAGHTIMENGPVKDYSMVYIDTGAYKKVYNPSSTNKYDLTVMELGDVR